MDQSQNFGDAAVFQPYERNNYKSNMAAEYLAENKLYRSNTD